MALRAWVERAGGSDPRMPMWTSAESWCADVRAWAYSPAFGEVCAAVGVSISAATVVAVARVMAEHADHATGRHVAVTRATIAERVGCDVRTVTAAWRVLRGGKWAVEAQRGHGSAGTPAAGRRPSVYHLVPRKLARPVHDFHLPPKAGSCLLTPVGNHSPSARHRAPDQNLSPSPPRRRYRAQPRPLPVQRLAADLVARTHGLHRGHIGAVCDAITAAGINPDAWSARSIAAALDDDMRARGWSWPDRIERPGAFLASRLGRLDWQRNAPPKGAGTAAASPEQAGPHRAEPVPPARVVPTPAQQQRRRQQLDEARTAIRQRRHTATPTPRGAAHAALNHSGVTSPPVCVVCKAAGEPVPVRRRYRGLLGPHMCGPCWQRVADQSASAG